MDITQPGGQYQIPLDFELELEETNPFLSDKGSQSLPVKLPYSPHNLALLDNPQRLSRTSKLLREYPAQIRHGSFQKLGRQIVFSASRENGIQTTFYLKEAEFYSQMQDIQLADTLPDNMQQQGAATLVTHLAAVAIGGHPDYAVFPVAWKADKNDSGQLICELLNAPILPDGSAAGAAERVIDSVRVPIGYGVAPFLYVHRLLDLLFAHFGYTLQPSLFHTDPDLKQLVQLHNTADVICAGKLRYPQLVPSVTVADYLDFFRNKFGCEFLFDGGTRTVEVKLFDDILAQAPDLDLTPYVVGTPVVTYAPFRQLVLSSGTSIEYAEPAADTIEQLFSSATFATIVGESAFSLAPNKVSVGEVVFRAAAGQYYRQISADGKVGLVPIGSSYFPYHKKAKELEVEERSASDEQVPLIWAYGSNYLLKNGAFGPIRMPGTIPVPFIGSVRHLNTGIKKTGEQAKEEKNGDCKIMVCFARGGTGTPLCYDVTGAKVGKLSLQYAGAEGLFQRFWKRYDAVLRHAFQSVTCQLNMSLEDFLRFTVYTPKTLNGTPVIPVSIKYSISSKGLRVKEAEFRTLHLQHPYNLADEQAAPVFDTDAQYYWQRVDNISAIAATYNTGTRFSCYGIAITSPPDARTYTPPTEEQFTAGGRYHGEQYQMKVYSPAQRTSSANPGTCIAECAYTTWLEPRKRSTDGSSGSGRETGGSGRRL